MDYILSAPEVLTRLPINWTQWVGAVLGSVMVGLSGVLPLFLVPANKKGGNTVSDENLKYLLGFAVGGLLGDVFLHLLPETYQHMIENNEENGHTRIGSAILCGILTFVVLEKILELSNPETNPELREASNKKIVGYLNLLANCTDNLLHGLAVGKLLVMNIDNYQKHCSTLYYYYSSPHLQHL